MQLIITDDYNAMSRAAAQLIADSVQAKPDATMIVAVGNSPLGTFRELARLWEEGSFDPSRLRIFQLDEYLEVGANDPRSLYGWVKRDFLDLLHIHEEQCIRLRGDNNDHEATCRAYDDAVLSAGGVDISVLGLGPNGHLGFNEPPSSPLSPTRTITLTEESLVSNAIYWGGRDRVPQQAITCGMTHLLAARQTLLLVSGEHKQHILRKTIAGPMTPDVPSSYLQSIPDVTVIADRAAWPHGTEMPDAS